MPTYIVTNEVRHPEPEIVGQKIVAALANLRQRTADFSRPAYTLRK